MILQKKINSLFPLLLLMMAVIYKVSPEEMAVLLSQIQLRKKKPNHQPWAAKKAKLTKTEQITDSNQIKPNLLLNLSFNSDKRRVSV